MTIKELRQSLDRILDLFLPRAYDVAKFDTLDLGALTQHTHDQIFHRKVSSYAPLKYSSSIVRSCVHAAKYHGHVRAAQLLGEALSPYVAELIAEKELFGTYEQPIIVPVPLHKQRKKERGFNQAGRIAEVVARETSTKLLDCHNDVLIRVRDTAPQAKLNRKVRLQNLKSAFKVVKEQAVKNADIILIDDVVTTGATMASAKSVLLDAGARNVLCVAATH